MTANWIKYFEQKVKPLNPTDVEYRDTKYRLSRIYYFQESYLSVDFSDSNTINRVELGTYKTGKFSDYKILFDNSAPKFTKVKQRLFEIDENENFVLFYDNANVENLNVFLDNLFTKGWKVEIISFKGFDYLIKVEINTTGYRIELKSDVEQDVPMPTDFLERKISVMWKNLRINSGNISKEKLVVKPLIKNIAKQSV